MSRIQLDEGPDAGMTWHFGQPLIEQRTMAAGAGAVLLSSREFFTVTGEQRLSWLHTLTTQALGSLQPGQGADALVLSPTGQIVHGFGLLDDGSTAWCWTEPGGRESLVGWLESMKFWTPVEIASRDDLRLWWLGREVSAPAEAVAARPGAVAGGSWAILPEPTDAMETIEAMETTETGQWAFEALRIAEGTPRIGLDTDAKTLPNELGLFATALDKGCYPGQETVARVHTLGRPPRRLVRLLFDGDLPQPGAEILLNDRVVGRVGTVAQHFELGPVGLALVKRSVPVNATLVVDGIAAAQEALVDPEVGEHFRPQL